MGYEIKENHFRDIYGNLLWVDKIILSSLHGIGELFIYDYKKYIVRRVAIADKIQHVNVEKFNHLEQCSSCVYLEGEYCSHHAFSNYVFTSTNKNVPTTDYEFTLAEKVNIINNCWGFKRK